MKFLSIFLLTLLISLEASATLPQDLIINNQPIDAICFFDMESKDKIINLQNCGLNKHNFALKKQNSRLTNKGFIGYDYKSTPNLGGAEGYSYYKFFNAGHHQYWIYSINNGGGSGNFTSIQLVKRRNATTMELKSISGGDRCSGGVQIVSIKHKQLTYSVNLTAYDFINLSKKHNSSKAYEDLAACAVCCVAKVIYTINPSKAKAKLQYVALNDIQDPKNMPQQGTHQECFNQLFVSYVKTAKTHFNKNNIDVFANQFNQTCLK